jgi:hypothetical protein
MCLTACGGSFQSSSEELSEAGRDSVSLAEEPEASVKLEASVWLEANVPEVSVVDAGTDVMLLSDAFEASLDVELIKETSADVMMGTCSSEYRTAFCDGAVCIASPCNDQRPNYWSCTDWDTPPSSDDCVDEGFIGFNNQGKAYCCASDQ